MSPRSISSGMRRRPIDAAATASGGSVSSAPIDRARSHECTQQIGDQQSEHLLFRHVPERFGVALEIGGVLERRSHCWTYVFPHGAGLGAGTDDSAAHCLPVHGVVDQLTDREVVAGGGLRPVIVGDLGDHVGPLLCGLSPDRCLLGHRRSVAAVDFSTTRCRCGRPPGGHSCAEGSPCAESRIRRGPPDREHVRRVRHDPVSTVDHGRVGLLAIERDGHAGEVDPWLLVFTPRFDHRCHVGLVGQRAGLDRDEAGRLDHGRIDR